DLAVFEYRRDLGLRLAGRVSDLALGHPVLAQLAIDLADVAHGERVTHLLALPVLWVQAARGGLGFLRVHTGTGDAGDRRFVRDVHAPLHRPSGRRQQRRHFTLNRAKVDL